MGTLKNLGYIKQALYFPCVDSNPILVLEAALESVAPTLVAAASFGCTDIVKMRAGISPWHSRGIKALINGAINPDEKSMAGKALKFTIPVEKALFFFFVVDLTVGFAANWQSNLFKLGGCGGKPVECTGSGPYASFVAPVGGAWVHIAYALSYAPAPCHFGSGTDFIVQPGQYWQAYFSLTAKPLFQDKPMTSLQTRLKLVNAVDIAITQEPQGAPWFGNQISSSIMAKPNKPAGSLQRWRFEAMADVEAVGTGGSAAITVSDHPIHNEGLIPVNCFGAPAPSAG